MLLKFTLRLFTSILGKELVYENDQFLYLVAPLLPHSQIGQNADKYIDWNEVKKAEYEHLEVNMSKLTKECVKIICNKMLYKVQKNCIYMNISITTEDSEVGSQHCTLSIYDSVVGQASSKSDTIAIKLAAQIVLEKIEKDDEYLDSGCEFDSGCCCSS
nr:14459_t:CDS:2 [Entrophospora candida]